MSPGACIFTQFLSQSKVPVLVFLHLTRAGGALESTHMKIAASIIQNGDPKHSFSDSSSPCGIQNVHRFNKIVDRCSKTNKGYVILKQVHIFNAIKYKGMLLNCKFDCYKAMKLTEKL